MTPISKAPLSKSVASQVDLRGTNLYRVAIIGAASLSGKEIAEILRDRNFPAADVRLLDDDDSLGRLEAVGDEINFIQSIRSEQFERVDFAFFAADPHSTRNNWKVARDLGDAINIKGLSRFLQNLNQLRSRDSVTKAEAGEAVDF